MERLALFVPSKTDLSFRRQLLSDPATMSYNAPWFPPDGCIPFPEEDWEPWADAWLGQKDRFYAYLRRTEDGIFVGETSLRDCGDFWEMGIVVCSSFRAGGYGEEGLELLLREAFLRRGVSCLHNDFEKTRAAALRIHLRAGFTITDEENGFVHLQLTKEDYFRSHPVTTESITPRLKAGACGDASPD